MLDGWCGTSLNIAGTWKGKNRIIKQFLCLLCYCFLRMANWLGFQGASKTSSLGMGNHLFAPPLGHRGAEKLVACHLWASELWKGSPYFINEHLSKGLPMLKVIWACKNIAGGLHAGSTLTLGIPAHMPSMLGLFALGGPGGGLPFLIYWEKM